MPLFTINITTPAVNINLNVPASELFTMIKEAINEAQERFVNQLILNQQAMAKTLDEVLESVKRNATIGESAVTLMTELKTKLDKVLAGTVIPAAVQAKIDEIFNVTEADTAKLEAAITENTPEGQTTEETEEEETDEEDNTTNSGNTP